MWEQSLAELWCKTARLVTAYGRAVCGWYVECVCVCVEYSYVGTVWVVWLRRVWGLKKVYSEPMEHPTCPRQIGGIIRSTMPN